MRRQQIYIDTSVIGGCLDEQFAEESRAVIEMARRGEVTLLVSELLLRELQGSPSAVADVLAELPSEAYLSVPATPEATALRRQYIAAGVLPSSARNDALHVAIATVHRADLIVSWNFRHLVNVARIRGFNAVNLAQGYQPIDIRSPREVMVR